MRCTYATIAYWACQRHNLPASRHCSTLVEVVTGAEADVELSHEAVDVVAGHMEVTRVKTEDH